MNFISSIGSAVNSLGHGLFVTLKNFTLRRPITVQYPDERLELPERFRGYVEFLFDPQTGQPLCTACMACERICPPTCISLAGSRKPEGKGMRPDFYFLDHGHCMQCSLCIEVCPADALAWNKNYERTVLDKDELHYDYRRPGFDAAESQPGKPEAPHPEADGAAGQ